MKTLVLAAVLLQAAGPALAQADGNLAPGGIVDGAKAGINAAEGTAPNGRPAPGEGQQAGTSGGKMVKQDEAGAPAQGKAGAAGKP